VRQVPQVRRVRAVRGVLRVRRVREVRQARRVRRVPWVRRVRRVRRPIRLRGALAPAEAEVEEQALELEQRASRVPQVTAQRVSRPQAEAGAARWIPSPPRHRRRPLQNSARRR
jgi:hypothetical protein